MLKIAVKRKKDAILICKLGAGWAAERFEMASASSGLRHPASASCLGRHARLAGRCPSNSSLFPPLAAVVVVASHIQRKNYFYFAFGATAFAERSAAMKAPVGLLSGRAVCVSRWRDFALTSSAERSKRYFHGWGRNGKQHLQRRFLRKRGAAGKQTLSVIATRCHLPREGEVLLYLPEDAKKLPLRGSCHRR